MFINRYNLDKYIEKIKKNYKGNFSEITEQDLYYDGYSNPYIKKTVEKEYKDEDVYWDNINNDSINNDDYLLKLRNGEITRIR